MVLECRAETKRIFIRDFDTLKKLYPLFKKSCLKILSETTRYHLNQAETLTWYLAVLKTNMKGLSWISWVRIPWLNIGLVQTTIVFAAFFIASRLTLNSYSSLACSFCSWSTILCYNFTATEYIVVTACGSSISLVFSDPFFFVY